jgi:hypothetical protein
MSVESDSSKPTTSCISRPIRQPAIQEGGECEPTGLEFSFPSIVTTKQMQQCEGTSSEPMSFAYGRTTHATHTYRDTIFNARRGQKASTHGRRAGDKFLLVNPDTNVVDTQMTTRSHVLRPRPRRPGPHGIYRPRSDGQILINVQSFGQTLSEDSTGCETSMGEARSSAFGHHLHGPTAAVGGGNIKDSQWMDVHLPVATKVSPSPLLCLDLDSAEDHGSPIQLSMKPIPPDLDILSVVTGSTIRWTEDATPPPSTFDPRWGAVLTLSNNEGSTLTPETRYSSLD